MDFHKLARFIIALGVVVLIYGGIQILVNMPEKFDRSKSQRGPFGGRNDIGNWLDTQRANSAREQNRKSAVKFLIAGAVVTFLGIGVNASSRKPSDSEEQPEAWPEGSDSPNSVTREGTGSTLSEEQLMEQHGITHDGDKYCFSTYRYEQLSDAVSYAKLQADKDV